MIGKKSVFDNCYDAVNGRVTVMNSNRRNIHARVFLVTGATGAIGKAISREFAGLEQSEVVLMCRDKRKAEQTVKELIDITGNSKVRFELGDLSRYHEIRELAERYRAIACLNQQRCMYTPNAA